MSGTGRLEEWLLGPDLPLPIGGLTNQDLAAARTFRDAIDNVARARVAGRDAAAVEPGLDATLSVIARDALRPRGYAVGASMKGCGEMVASASYRPRRTAQATQ